MEEQEDIKWLSTLQGDNLTSSNELEKQELILINVIIKYNNEKIRYNPNDIGFNKLL